MHKRQRQGQRCVEHDCQPHVLVVGHSPSWHVLRHCYHMLFVLYCNQLQAFQHSVTVAQQASYTQLAGLTVVTHLADAEVSNQSVAAALWPVGVRSQLRSGQTMAHCSGRHLYTWLVTVTGCMMLGTPFGSTVSTTAQAAAQPLQLKCLLKAVQPVHQAARCGW